MHTHTRTDVNTSTCFEHFDIKCCTHYTKPAHFAASPAECRCGKRLEQSAGHKLQYTMCVCVCVCDAFDRKCIQLRFHILRNLIGRFKSPYGRTQNVLNREIKVSTFSEVGGWNTPHHIMMLYHTHTHTHYITQPFVPHSAGPKVCMPITMFLDNRHPLPHSTITRARKQQSASFTNPLILYTFAICVRHPPHINGLGTASSLCVHRSSFISSAACQPRGTFSAPIVPSKPHPLNCYDMRIPHLKTYILSPFKDETIDCLF